MGKKFECLVNLETGKKLSETEEVAIKDLIDCVKSLKKPGTSSEEVYENLDNLYLFAKLAKNKIIKEDDQKIFDVFRTVLKFAIYYDYIYDAYEKYPLAFDYMDELIDDLPATTLRDLHDFYKYDLENEEMAFKCALAGAQAYPQGLTGGMFLVNTLLYIDACKYLTGTHYMDGVGVEKDYVKAFIYFISYRTDHLCIKHGDCGELFIPTLSKLFDLMKEESDNGINYPGLHYSLAIMYREGIGTNYNYEKYLECAEKEKQNYVNADVDRTYLDLLEEYISKENINVDLNGESYKNVKTIDNKDIKIGDIIDFGHYNYRSVLWRVLDIKDDRALLYSTDILESSYIANGRGFANGTTYNKSKIREFTNDLVSPLLEGYTNGDYDYVQDNYLLPNDDGDYVFLLKKEDLMDKNLIKDLRARSREQAALNGYDSYGVSVNEDGYSPYFTSSDGDEENLLYYVDEYGDVEQEYMYRDCIGIRPAIYLKLKK